MKITIVFLLGLFIGALVVYFAMRNKKASGFEN